MNKEIVRLHRAILDICMSIVCMDAHTAYYYFNKIKNNMNTHLPCVQHGDLCIDIWSIRIRIFQFSVMLREYNMRGELSDEVYDDTLIYVLGKLLNKLQTRIYI